MPKEKEFIKNSDGSKIGSPKSEDMTGEQLFDFRQMKPKKQKTKLFFPQKSPIKFLEKEHSIQELHRNNHKITFSRDQTEKVARQVLKSYCYGYASNLK